MLELGLTALYPPELLSASLEDRMHYFVREAVVDHPIFREVLDRLEVLAAFPTSRNLVLLIGGTGAGKTTLLKTLCARINSKHALISEQADQVGCVFVPLRPPKKGTFDFSVLHRAVLLALGAPLVGKTRPIVVRAAGALNLPTLLVERDIAALRGEALETRFFREIEFRKPRALLLDEAMSIFKTAKPKSDDDRLDKLKNQADIVKGMASHAECTVVLSGAYDFFELSLSSGQNARRTVIVHIEPYDSDTKGIQGFVEGLTSLLCHLPATHSIDPITAATELFLQGLGCIGIAAGILAEALCEAIVTDKMLTIELVRKYYYSKAALDVMRKELDEGRRRVNAFLTLEDLMPTTPAAPEGTEATSVCAKSDKSGIGSRPLKPGDTKPSHMAGAKSAW